MTKAEQAFDILARALGLPAAVAEYRFHPVRRWRFDFAWPGKQVAVEVEGVTKWGAIGRHQSAGGYAKDCEKYNAAAELGWRVFRYTQDMIGEEAIEQVRRALK